MIIDELKTIIDTVAAAVSDLNYTAYTPIDEPTAYPALIPIGFRKEFQRITVNGQVYTTRFNINFNLFASKDMTEANFATLFDTVIAQIIIITGFQYITIQDVEYGVVQVGEDALQGYDFTVEYMKKENF